MRKKVAILEVHPFYYLALAPLLSVCSPGVRLTLSLSLLAIRVLPMLVVAEKQGLIQYPNITVPLSKGRSCIYVPSHDRVRMQFCLG